MADKCKVCACGDWYDPREEERAAARQELVDMAAVTVALEEAEARAYVALAGMGPGDERRADTIARYDVVAGMLQAARIRRTAAAWRLADLLLAREEATDDDDLEV